MIWSEFKESVRNLLTVDAQRKGAGIQNYIDAVILSGVIELQQYIPTLRLMNRDTFFHDQMSIAKPIELQGVQQGFTKGKGKITKAVVLKPSGDKVIAIPLNKWPWDKRNSLAMGCLNDCRSARFPGKIMHDQREATSGSFYVYPALTPDELLILDWEGVKTGFDKEDITPYDNRVVKVISDYTKAHIVREVDKDIQLYKEYYGMYVKERAVLYLDEKDSTLFDMPSVSEDYYSTCCIETDSLNRLVALPTAPQFVQIIVSPQYAPSSLASALLPEAPASLSVDNCRKTAYHTCAISNSDPQISIEPTGLGFNLQNNDGTVFNAPTGLHPYVGVPSEPSGLIAMLRAKAPTGLTPHVLVKPVSPTVLNLEGFVPDTPTGLGMTPLSPSGLQWSISTNDAIVPPFAPQGLQVFAIAPTGLIAKFSNASGTITFPDSPLDLIAIHDGVGGGWLPDAPRGLEFNVEGVAPNSPTDFSQDFELLRLVRYTYNEATGKFEEVEDYLVSINPLTGATITIE